MKTTTDLCFLLSAFCFSAFQLLAANVCVGPSATGSGSGADWSNIKSWSSIAGTFTRGNVYFVKDSDGTQYLDDFDFTQAESGTTQIIIRKATAASHGTETGWVSTMGDGQAYFEGAWDFASGYWVLDGGTRNESNWGDKTPYGICVTNSGAACAYADPRSCNSLIFSNVVFLGNPDDPPDPPQGWRTFYITSWGNGAGDMTGLVFSRCLFKGGVNQIYAEAANVDGALVEYTYFDTTKNSDGNHGESVNLSTGGAGGWTLRWNVWTNCVGTSVIAMNNNDGIEVYGNLFINGYGANGVFGYASDTGSDNNKFYNNTVVGDAANGGVVLGGSGNTAYNNLFVTNVSLTISGTHNYNAFSGSGLSEGNQQTGISGANIFVNYGTRDLRLAMNTTAGTNLGSPYDVDVLGNTRSTWSRGAYEYETGGDTTPPVISNVSHGTPGTTSATITWTLSETSTNNWVGYGTADTLGSWATNETDTTSASVSLSGLAASTLYYYAAWSVDASNNSTNSSTNSFTTATPATVGLTPLGRLGRILTP